MRLWQNAPRQHEVGHTQGAEPHENRSPAPQAAEPGADQRSDRGACGHEQICERQSPRGLMRLRRIADDGAGEDQPRTSAYSLEKAREDERMGVGGEKRGNARNREYREADEQHRPTAEAIRRRPVDQLADGQAQDVETDCQLQSSRRRVKVFHRGGKRRHEYVHADRPAESEQAQQPERDGASAIEGHRAAVPLRSVASDRASARLRSRSLTVSRRRSERAKSWSETSPRTTSRMSW